MALAVLQAAQQLALLSPSFEQPITPGQTVTVSWKSPYEFTNVEVLQGPDSTGAYQTDILAANATQNMNSLSWTAESAPGNDFSIPFLFRLQKGDLPNDCVLCTTTTSAFTVVDPNAPAPDTSSPQATSAQTAELMPSVTTSIAGATTAATEATSSPSTDAATESTMQTASSAEQATSATSASEMMAMPTESSTDTAAVAAATSSSETSMASSTPAAATSSAAAMSSPAASPAVATSATAASATTVPTSTTEFQQMTEKNYRAPSKETLALGLGIGIPIGLLAIGMIVFLLWDKKRKQKKYASSEMGHDEQRRGEDVESRGEKKGPEVSVRESRGSGWTGEDSHKSGESFHERFEFEDDGRLRESWLQEAVRAGRETWV